MTDEPDKPPSYFAATANPIGGVSEPLIELKLRLDVLYKKSGDMDLITAGNALFELRDARAQRSADVVALNLKDEQIIKLSRELEVAEAVRSDQAFSGALADELHKTAIAQRDERIAEMERALTGRQKEDGK